MPSFDHLLPFLVATFLIAVFPGPALLYTAAQTLARGRLAGCMAALGIHIGGYAHVPAAVLGLQAVFRHVPELYFAVKLAGAAYLVWLGIGILRARALGALPQVRARSARRALAQSIAVQGLNPKVALFCVAFLPQFVDPAAAAPVKGVQPLAQALSPIFPVAQREPDGVRDPSDPFGGRVPFRCAPIIHTR